MRPERASITLVMVGLFAAFVSADRTASLPNILMGLAVVIGLIPVRPKARPAATLNGTTDPGVAEIKLPAKT